jgi:putative ABC transport system permease protein
MGKGNFIQALLQETRYALRRLRQSPGFTVSAVVVAAIGIGASTAVFSVVDRILFRSLPYAQDSQLVSVGVTAPIEHEEFMLGPQYYDWKDHQKPFQELTSWRGVSDCDLTAGEPIRIGCAQVEANFLTTLGVRPLVGHNFVREDDVPNGPHVAIISYALWRSRFAGGVDIVGRKITIDGIDSIIAGVLPRDFELPTLADADVLMPQQLDEAAQRRSPQGQVLQVFGRLRPGTTIQQAEAQLQPLFNDFLNFVPPQFRSEVKLKVRSIRDRQMEQSKRAATLLLGAVLAVLLIACANVANLLLARSASRRRELAIRAALGGSRSRIALVTLTESLSIGLLGGAAGTVLAFSLIRLFLHLAPHGIPHLQQAGIDLRVLGFALLASMLSAAVFGIAPAMQPSDPQDLTSWHGARRHRSWFRQALIVGQVAGSLVLLFSAGLLMRTLWNVENGALGMSSGGVVTGEVVLNPLHYRTPESQLAFFEELEVRLKNMPGADDVALSDSLPPTGNTRSTILAGIEVEGRPRFAGGTGGTVLWRVVSPDYFSVLQIPILQGRGFREEDRLPGRNAIVISQMLAHRLFPGQVALGQRVEVNNAPPWFTIVGVANDVRNNGIVGEEEPEYYLVRAHAPDYGLGARMQGNALRGATAIVRTSGDQKLMEQRLRAEIHGLDPTLPVDIATLDQRVGMLAQRPRFNAMLLDLFAGMALVMAAAGLYGMISFLVLQRTREIGVRMAVGATPPRILRMILAYALRWLLVGMAIGCCGALLSARVLQSLLFHVSTMDPWALSISTAMLLGVALLAAWVPSWRASQVDPLVALRDQ